MTASTLADVLHSTGIAAASRIALRGGSRELTYHDFDNAASSVAANMRAIGVRRGDRVAIALPNDVDAAIAIYGALRAGAVIVPLNPTIKSAKLASILNDCTPSMLICTATTAETISHTRDTMRELRIVVTGAEPEPDLLAFDDLRRENDFDNGGPLEVDLAAIIYTSGSTGIPKGVMMTHRNMVFAATCISRLLEMSAADRVLSVLPLSFDYGLYQLFLCVQVGATLFLESGIGYPGRLVSMMTEQGITGLPGVPTLFRVLLSLPRLGEHDWTNLRFLTNTAAALSKDTIHALRTTFPHAKLYSMYGLTECKRVSYLPPSELDRRPDSVGLPIPGTDVWIEDEAGNRLGPGQVGELMVRGPHVMQGYWRDVKSTSQCLREGEWPSSRTLATGDLFRSDDAGFLYFVGRQDDMIKSRGEKISPREVEDVLLAAPGVLDAAVIGMPHEVLGQEVCAHVSPRPGVVLELQALSDFCRARLEDHVVPTRIFIHDELPKMASGKIDRQALKNGDVGKSAATTAGSANSPDFQKQLATLFAESRRLIGHRATDVPAGVSIADWVNISRFVEATGDENPLYLDVRYSAESWWRTMLAPPAFVLGIQVPQSTGALHARDYDVVDMLTGVELWWNDHIKLGDRVSADLHIADVSYGRGWRGRETVEITSSVVYKSESRHVAAGTGVVRMHPLLLGEEFFVERAIYKYTDEEIERIEAGLNAEPAPRGSTTRFHADVTVGEQLPQIVRGPFTWSELITWIIAEGRPAPAGNIRHRSLVQHPGNVRPHATTGWPISDRKHAREDLLACAGVGFRAPCAREPFIVSLVTQLITTWMGDDAFLRHLSTSLHLPVLYGDTLWLNGTVTKKFVQQIGEREYFAIAIDVDVVNQIGEPAATATAIVLLPEPGRPLLLPLAQERN